MDLKPEDQLLLFVLMGGALLIGALGAYLKSEIKDWFVRHGYGKEKK